MVRDYFRTISAAVLVALALVVFPVQVSAHSIFKKTLEKEVEGLKVTCFACHVKKKPKSERNEFGELFFKEFEGKEFTKKWEELKEDKDAQKAFESDEMAPAFVKALETIGEMETEEGDKYADLIAQGKIEGTKLKKTD